MKPLLLLLLPAMLIGCASTPEEDQARAKERYTYCDREGQTGSRMTSTRCRTAEDRAQNTRDVEAISEAARRADQISVRSTPAPANGSGR